MSFIEVKDFDLTETKTINKVQINDVRITLNSHCDVNYCLFGGDGSNLLYIKSGMLKIEGDEYTAWGSSDQYLQDLVLTKLGLIISL